VWSLDITNCKCNYLRQRKLTFVILCINIETHQQEFEHKNYVTERNSVEDKVLIFFTTSG
jgi:hypothetical protein